MEPAGLFFVKLLLCLLHEGDHVAHAEDAVGDTFGVEDVERFHLFAGGDELDGFADHGLDGEGRTAAGITVHLGEDHAVEVEAVVEGLGGLHGILAGHRIDHEQGLGRADGLVQRGDLVHQRLVHGQTAGGIDHHHGESFPAGFGDGVPGDLDRVFHAVFAVAFHLDLSAEGLELLDGGGAEGVAGGHQDFHPALTLEIERQLATEGGFTGTVEAGHQHDAGVALDVDVGGVAAHEFRQLVVDDLDHHLLRPDGLEHVLADGLLLDLVAETLGDLITDIGVKECLAHVLHRLGDIDFRDAALALDQAERVFQPLA